MIRSGVAIWDTLLPTSKARIKSFNAGESGAYSLAYSPRHQLLACGGKKGDICKLHQSFYLLSIPIKPSTYRIPPVIFDMRQRILRKSIHAHENNVKSLAIVEDSGLLVSGSAGGDIKVILTSVQFKRHASQYNFFYRSGISTPLTILEAGLLLTN
jgi:WD40 repeat protein